MDEPTLQRRGVASVLIAFLVIWFVLLGYVYMQSRRIDTSAPGLDQFSDALGDALAPVADVAQAQAVMAATSQWLNVRRQAEGRLPGLRLYELLDSQGRRVWASPPLRGIVLPSAFPSLTPLEVGGIAHNVYESRSARWTLRVIEPLRTDAAFLAYNGRWLMPYLMLALPIILGGVWLSVRNGLMPLQQLARSIAERAPGDLSPLALQVRHRELRPLSEALDHLFARLKHTVESERFFVQDAAHEIRTPLAVITAQAHVLAHADGLQVREEALQHLNHAVSRASHLAQQLLLLASLDEGRRPPPQRSNVTQALRQWLAPMATVAMARGIELELDAPDALMAAVDEAALASIVDNLVDNAVRYGRPDGRIVVHLLDEGERLTLLVRDDGPGIAAADRERAFQRFWRGSGHIDVAGSGLGLAIVRQAAQGMGGNATLTAGLEGRGVGFRISVPNADFRAG
ncbi:sensor histidine kinase [Variovorax ginsengisoli]|uniref:histidine kinase n=1 Tax=Variovorax ginsengisoli TaxID=363844 RepID=A0ABT9S3J9_9BURK|nr:ATP-binding protein [Variovorax ginsengisoli]MDP9898366.1 signal transduction histidine kinase [Variovorax ginsengisoli]